MTHCRNNLKRIAPFVWAVFSANCVGTDIINEDSVPARIDISPSMQAVQVDSLVQFQATYFDSLGLPVADAQFQWRSEVQGVVEIDANGLAKGLAPGQTTITASSAGIVSEPALLTVVADQGQIATIQVTPSSLELAIGDTAHLEARALNLDAVEIPGTAFTWRSTSPGVAEVDTAGVVRCITDGETQITASNGEIASNPVLIRVVSANQRSGGFSKRPGTSYIVRGTATLLKHPGNRLELQFGSDFFCSSGPGLAVYLSTDNSVRSSSVNLGSLKSTVGVQSYAVPAGTRLTDFDWVVIHCVPFNVTFGYAGLE